MQAGWAHTTVMLREAVDALVHEPAGSYIDATFGRGGHSRAILEVLAPEGRLLAFDKDPEAIASAHAIEDRRFSIQHASFARMADLPAHSADGILLDLGVSSPQLDNPQRGFSFQKEGPLDMRMDPTVGISVADWLADASEEQIASVIHEYGEERYARNIARTLVQHRQQHGLPSTTTGLAALVAQAVKSREPGKNPATRTFQALRIFINAELQDLQQALHASLRLLRPGGRLVVISFHSLEDRLVKQFMVQHSREVYDRSLPAAFATAPRPMPLTDVARIRPTQEEVQGNARARSAILRVATFTGVQLS